ILHVDLGNRAFVSDTRIIHEPDLLDDIEHRRTHRARVHAHGPAHAAGDAFEKFQPRQPGAPRLDGDSLEFYPRATVKFVADDFQATEVRMAQGNHHAPDAAIADEEIRAAAEHD